MKSIIILLNITLFTIVTSCSNESENELPIALFSLSPQEPISGDTVTFDATTSYDPNGEIINYLWQINSEDISEGITMTKYFPLEGEYEITLTVTDNNGGKGKAVETIHVLSSMQLNETYNLNISAPSGLAFSPDLLSFWTVSDKPGGHIYHMALNGEILSTLTYSGSDLEGISYNDADKSFWVVEESSGELVHLDSSSAEIDRVYIAGSIDGSGGLEGVAFNKNNGHIFLLKEKDPGVLIELDQDLNVIQYNRIFFADDYAGLWYEETLNQLWIVSDQDKIVFRCDTTGVVLKSYSIQLDKMEGIAVDMENKHIYLVNDLNNRLYKYNLMDR